MRRSNQLSYEATDVGSWSFVGFNVAVTDESTMKWIINEQSEMAASRFASLSEENTTQLLNDKDSENTKKSTKQHR